MPFVLPWTLGQLLWWFLPEKESISHKPNSINEIHLVFFFFKIAILQDLFAHEGNIAGIGNNLLPRPAIECQQSSLYRMICLLFYEILHLKERLVGSLALVLKRGAEAVEKITVYVSVLLGEERGGKLKIL